ncbi:PREDICTED: uncharacterized protein LOC106746232 [Dinoponera quadriceps]|uniref:Uncharacterized protein LOC106746232 n=1 Tax=Dinoponera quadriceps TaxID=609295 RepID=A0A6P3XJ84_DINQU|nr:PREDICTED: uncharacterized protein LOC106746232 [Dinoponera quadriceps]
MLSIQCNIIECLYIYIVSCDMDADILRTILRSFGDAKNITESEDYKNISREVVLQSDVVSDTLCASLSNLLCYKVSKQVYQRYSIRLLIIDIVRKWCRATSNFDHLQIFTSERNGMKYVTTLLNKYLTDDVLSNCCSDDALVSLTSAVMHLSTGDPSFARHLDRLLVRLSRFETNDKIERLLRNALSTDLRLKLSTKEEIYLAKRSNLIEGPLLDGFTRMFSDASEGDRAEKRQHDEETLNRLLALSAESTRVFQMTFSFLKELLIRLRYAPAVTDFTGSLLSRVAAHCEQQDKDMVDLYPSRLRSCVILLRIKPEHHTARSKEYTLQTVKRIHHESKDAALILMSHFPEWLELLSTYVANDALS